MSDSTTGTAPTFAVTQNPAPASAAERAHRMDSQPFGTVFTDHLAKATWTAEQGWHDHRIEPFGDLVLHPGATVLHYGQQVFEGLKAYRWADGSIHLFRPEANAARLATSAHRMALAPLPEADFMASVEALLTVDEQWVPSADETSLYLRPMLIGTEPCLGVRPSRTVEYVLLASPVGAYFPNGVKPVSIWVAQGYHRAGNGGTGQAKTAGNYAASLLPQQQATDHGCDQVLFLDAARDTYVEELGGMNVFAVRRDGTIWTPRVTGTILEGVTRSSVIELLRAEGREVVERDISITELRDGIADGAIQEAFACGTAAVVTPIARLVSPDHDVVVGDGGPGTVTMALRQRLTDIQYGRADDVMGWMRRVG
ncbi:branched-chain amino acid aminotransferase [Demequina muriae]|uniref:Branched-chain-amino-acid aminotransferase n=1 Tax=Demequina muriae TaxID=3051664 RepID=A0ABT8GK00_9MICO|nr:branched-chain amino acid aminotransferase [Demequina sp. EGI L300058]MDN4481261.1 branched-chain amino acid aminotransferase [Demequina sp. EGI L300058]